MPELDPLLIVLLALAAFSAGFIDSVVGGGGLIQVPAMFSLFPREHPATLLGTGKLSGIVGTASAAWRYATTIRVRWSAALPASLAALVFAFAGAWSVTHVSPDLLRPLLPIALTVVFFYTLMRKDLGSRHEPKYQGFAETWRAALLGAVIGFYDGIFGPGTGSFLLFLYVRFFGLDFVQGSAAAKIVNVACNLAALTWFGLDGHVWWWVGLGMAVFNLTGSQIGSRLALKHGVRFVRVFFLVVVSLLIAKTAWDAFVA